MPEKNCLISIQTTVFRFIKRVTWDSEFIVTLDKALFDNVHISFQNECQF